MGFAWLIIAVWLQPVLAARYNEVQQLKVDRSTCPASAQNPEPDMDGDCMCDDDLGKTCYQKVPSGDMKRGCMASFEVNDYYFSVNCTTCECIQVPEIEDYGSYVEVLFATTVKIMRQGSLVTEFQQDRRILNYSFNNNLHKEFLVIAESSDKIVVEMPIFPRESELCGVGLFTSDHLVCSKLGAEGGNDVAEKVKAELTATHAPLEIERGFGIEFELVARNLPTDVKERMKKQTMSGFRWWVGRHVFNGIVGVVSYFAHRNNNTELVDILQNVSDLEAVLDTYGLYSLPGLEECFVNTTKSPDIINKPCFQTTDCALTQYCMDCNVCTMATEATTGGRVWDKATSWLPDGWKKKLPDPLLCKGCASRDAKICKPRTECEEGFSVGGGTCPTALQNWAWTLDPTVSPLQEEEAKALGVGKHESEGAGFELVSPPLSGSEGIRSTTEALTVLKRMGIQAGISSGMHVHVNVASNKVPGSQLSPRQIANLWVAFVKFQLVIDEMLSPSRVGNLYARRLFLGSCDPEEEEVSGGRCSVDKPCQCAKHFFKQIHAYVNNKHGDSMRDFCNAALALPDQPFPCDQQYPDQRYYALNLVPLVRLGTVEFRAHSATHDAERVLRWIQFVVAFVEHFGAETPTAANSFLDVSAEKGLNALAQEQRMATAEELFSSLEGKLHPGTKAFYESRDWEKNAPGCNIDAPPTLSDAAKLDAFRDSTAIVRSLGEKVIVSKIPGPEGDE